MKLTPEQRAMLNVKAHGVHNASRPELVKYVSQLMAEAYDEGRRDERTDTLIYLAGCQEETRKP